MLYRRNLGGILKQKESVKYWHEEDLHGMEMLSAHFVDHSFPKHFHDTFAIGVIEGGVEGIEYRGATHHLTSGNLVLLNPAEVHTGFSAHAVGWQYRMFYPDPDLLQEIAVEIQDRVVSTPFFKSPVVKDPVLARQLLELHRYVENGADPSEKQTLFREAFAQLILRHGEAKSSLPEPLQAKENIRRSCKFLNDNFSGSVDLRKLSAISGMSVFYFLRCFKKETGLTPHAYLMHLRIKRAKEMLYSGLSPAEVAAACGFVDQSHFHRNFKRYCGLTPGSFKKAISYNSRSSI